jgi:hypothetical protein
MTMHTPDINPSNVIAFKARPSTADLKQIAIGRSRKLALPVLIDRLRDLHKAAQPATVCMLVGGVPTNIPVLYAYAGDLQIEFCSTMGPDTYFAVRHSGSPSRLMTGYLYDTAVTPYHVMSWKRGEWQAELFEEAA